MGHEIEKVLAQRGHTLVCTVDPVASSADEKKLSEEILRRADVVIEFSLADAVKSNAEFYRKTEVAAVVGTTGWEQDLSAIRKQYESGGALVYGSNFSVGAHAFFGVVEMACRLVNQLPNYDVLVQEWHHKKKEDSPSGTALNIARRIIDAIERKSTIVTKALDRRISEDELHVSSVRGGSSPGLHSVLLDSDSDTIELRHTARNRGGFAYGAVLAAEWIKGKQGIFTVDEFIDDLFHSGGNS